MSKLGKTVLKNSVLYLVPLMLLFAGSNQTAVTKTPGRTRRTGPDGHPDLPRYPSRY